MSPYKRPRPQSPHGPHGIFLSPEHRFIAGGAHYSPNIYAAAPQRDVRQHVQEIPTINYPDHHSRDVGSFTSLQNQIRRRPSLLSEFHGGAAERERERSKEFFSRNIDPGYRLHSTNHHPENDIIAAKRRRLDNDTKFRPVQGNNSPSRVVTTSANQPEVKKEPFIPKVENVSPTPCDDESPQSKVSKEGLLQSMEKMDREIQMVESQIANLKKKKHELEQRAAQPREEEKAVADEDWEPKQENITQLIYAENQRKADAAHKDLAKCGGQNVLPLYNQISDIKNHKEVLKKNYELSRRFILYFKKQAAERSLREKKSCELYNRRMEAWENRMEKIDANPKKKVKDAKTREFFEKQFPEIRKQREQQERFSSRAGTRSWGNIARSDAELAEIVDGLNEQEAQERHMRSLTVIPPMLLEKEERNVNFRNTNGLVEDAMQEYKDRQRMNIWTDEEREIFREKYMQHPKNFGAIAQFLERKSVSDCVLYYYQNKKRENYKQRKQQVRRKKPLPPKNTNTTINRNQDDEDKDDKEDGSSQDPKKKDGGDSKEGLNGGTSQNGDASNGPPMSVPTNCALCHHSLDAYTMSRPLSKSNCELLGLNVNEVTANMRVCSKCRFRSLRKSPCPVTSCKTARRKAKRLKPLPTKWLEISEAQRKIISEEMGKWLNAEDHTRWSSEGDVKWRSHEQDGMDYDHASISSEHQSKKRRPAVAGAHPPITVARVPRIGSEITKCCPACFHRITRRLSNDNGPEPDPSISNDGENEEDLADTPDWTKKEINALKQALRKHGKNWSEVAKVVGTKPEGPCKDLYNSYKGKHRLDQIIEEYEKEKKKREHRVSVAESLGSTITAPSDDDLQVPSSDNDADESSDTASASENEDGPLRNKKPSGKQSGEKKTGEKGTTNSVGGVPKEPAGTTDSGEANQPAGSLPGGNVNDTSSEKRTEGKLGSESQQSIGNVTSVGDGKVPVGESTSASKTGDTVSSKDDSDSKKEVVDPLQTAGDSSSVENTKCPPVNSQAPVVNVTCPVSEAKGPVGVLTGVDSEDKMEVDPVRTESKPADDDGDTSATCSADEGNPMDVDVAFSDASTKLLGQLPQKPPARDRVSSSEDDTKLSELKAKLEVARADGKVIEEAKDPKVAGTLDTAPCEGPKTAEDQEEKQQQPPAEEGKSWSSHGYLNMRDLIHSAIHKHLGQERNAEAPPKAESQEAKPKTSEVSKAISTQSPDVVTVAKPVVTSPVTVATVHVPNSANSKVPARKTPPPVDRSEVKVIEPPMKTSHITHTSMHDRDIYEVSSTQRPPAGHRSPGKRLTSPASGYHVDPLQSRLMEGLHGASPAQIGTVPHPRGHSPRGPSPHGPHGPSPHGPHGPSPQEREQQGVNLHSPPGRHNYSPRSTSSSPYALIPAPDRHHPSGPARSLPRSKQTSVPPPPPLINKLSPMTAIKQEKLSPSGGIHGVAHTGSISQGIPVAYARDMAGVRFDGPSPKNDRLMMLARSPATSSPHHEYTGGSITQGTPLTRRDQPGRAVHHERLIEKEAAHQKDAHHLKPQRVKMEQPHGPEKGGWAGLPIVTPYDGVSFLPAELIKSLSDREVLKMADPSMLYMYTQRHLMQYGGEYGPGLVRGQYASEAYNSSKATLADDFATAQRMSQRMPLPTTSAAPSNPRPSPRQEAAVASAKRGSPAAHLPPHPIEGLPGIPFAPFGLPPQQGGYIMVPGYMPGMTVATVPPQLQHAFTSMAPTMVSPRSPHTQNTNHPQHANLDPKNHSPTVRAPSPSDAKLPRSWPGPGGGHFKAPARGPAPATVLMGQPHHPYGIPVHRAPMGGGGSIMQGTPMWRQQTTAASIVAGTPNPDLRDNRKSDRGPSPLPKSQAQAPSKRVEAQRMAEFNMARKDHPASIQHESEDVRRQPHHSSAPHDAHQQQPLPKRPSSASHVREQQPPQAHQERRPPTREGEPHHPSPSRYPHDRRSKTEKIEMESKDLLATMFEKDAARPGGKNVKAEHSEASGTGFTAASLIDHIIHQSINKPTDEEVQAEAKTNASAAPTTVTSQPPHTQAQPPSTSSQSKARLASNLIDQLIVQQIKHESPEDEKPPRPSSQSNPHQKTHGNVFNYNERSSHKSNHIDSTVSSIPQGQYRPVPILPQHSRPITIGDHINSIVSKGYTQSLQKASNVETVDSTTAHRGIERNIVRGENEMAYSSAQKNPRVVNDVHSMKGSRTVSPAVESGRVADSSTVVNYSKRLDGDGHNPCQIVQFPVSSSHKESKEAINSQGRAPSRESVRTMDAPQLPGGYQPRNSHNERDFARGQMMRTDGTLSRTPGGHKLPQGMNPAAHLPPHSAVKQQTNAAVNYSRESTNSGRPINFQESINRMIERQVRATDVNPVEAAATQERRPVSRGYEQVRGGDHYKRNMTIAQLQGQSNGPPKPKIELVANKENNIHSNPVVSSASGHMPHAGMPASSHPGMMPGYPYPVLNFVPNHQPAAHPAAAAAAMRGSSPSLLAAVPRASPGQVPGPRRDNQHAPLLSSEYECLSDDE